MEKIKAYTVHLCVVAALFGLAVGTAFFLRLAPAGWGAYSLKALLPVGENEQHHPETKSLELYHVLEKASMENRTVILTTLNEAWARPDSLFDLFRDAFRTGVETGPLLNHLVVIAVDQKAMDRCRSVHPHCYLFTIDGVDLSGPEKRFMTKEYLTWMWERTHFLGRVLELGFSFLLTDLDIIWFRTPFTHLSMANDFTFACDRFNGNPSDLSNLINGGFIYVRSNNKTIAFYMHWYEARTRFPGKHEQDVFNLIKKTQFVQNLGMSFRFLDTAIFGGFCHHGSDLAKMCTLHANCCIGLQNKIDDLTTILGIWKNYTGLPEEKKSETGAPWAGPVKCKF